MFTFAWSSVSVGHYAFSNVAVLPSPFFKPPVCQTFWPPTRVALGAAPHGPPPSLPPSPVQGSDQILCSTSSALSKSMDITEIIFDRVITQRQRTRRMTWRDGEEWRRDAVRSLSSASTPRLSLPAPIISRRWLWFVFDITTRQCFIS